MAYDEPEVEIVSTDISQNLATVGARVVLKCAECDNELKDAEIQAENTIDHGCDGDEIFEWEDAPSDAEGTNRLEIRDRHGKPIKSMRYMKTFYGFTCSGSVKCTKCKEVIELDFEGEEQASGFNELV